MEKTPERLRFESLTQDVTHALQDVTHALNDLYAQSNHLGLNEKDTDEVREYCIKAREKAEDLCYRLRISSP